MQVSYFILVLGASCATLNDILNAAADESSEDTTSDSFDAQVDSYHVQPNIHLRTTSIVEDRKKKAIELFTAAVGETAMKKVVGDVASTDAMYDAIVAYTQGTKNADAFNTSPISVGDFVKLAGMIMSDASPNLITDLEGPNWFAIHAMLTGAKVANDDEARQRAAWIQSFLYPPESKKSDQKEPPNQPLKRKSTGNYFEPRKVYQPAAEVINIDSPEETPTSSPNHIKNAPRSPEIPEVLPTESEPVPANPQLSVLVSRFREYDLKQFKASVAAKIRRIVFFIHLVGIREGLTFLGDYKVNKTKTVNGWYNLTSDSALNEKTDESASKLFPNMLLSSWKSVKGAMKSRKEKYHVLLESDATASIKRRCEELGFP